PRARLSCGAGGGPAGGGAGLPRRGWPRNSRGGRAARDGGAGGRADLCGDAAPGDRAAERSAGGASARGPSRPGVAQPPRTRSLSGASSRLMRRGPSVLGVAVLAAVLAARLAGAHDPPRVVTREIVWLKGQRRGGGVAPAGRMTVHAQGADHDFAVAEREGYGLTDAAAPAPSVPDRVALQGPRELLSRFAAAGPSPTIILLGDRRARGRG